MAATAATGSAQLAVDEARLARAAAGGDGNAFASLYERYEMRAFNLAHRVTGSEEDAADAVQEAFLSVMRRLPKLQDRELEFGSYLFTATRNASYDLMRSRQRAQPSDAIPESAAPVGSGAGGLGLDPGDPEDDPDRKVLLESQQDEIREASMRLPERQREALALRELEELSYDEIAAIMDMNRNSVAQLISRARIGLRDELRSTALAAVAAASPDCERALPLIAMRDDGQLDGDSEDATWLDAHLAGCERCQLGREAMQEAGVSYRAWAPIAPAPWLLDETMARAAELAGADWSEAAAEVQASRADPSALPGMPAAYVRTGGGGGARRYRRRAVAAAGLAALLFAGGLATLLRGNDSAATPETRAGPATAPAAAPVPRRTSGKSSAKAKQGPVPQPTSQDGDAEPVVPVPVEPAATSDGDKDSGGGRRAASQHKFAEPPRNAGVQAPRAIPGREPTAEPAPAPTPTSPPPPTTEQEPTTPEPEPPPEPESEPEPPNDPKRPPVTGPSPGPSSP